MAGTVQAQYDHLAVSVAKGYRQDMLRRTRKQRYKFVLQFGTRDLIERYCSYHILLEWRRY